MNGFKLQCRHFHHVYFASLGTCTCSYKYLELEEFPEVHFLAHWSGVADRAHQTGKHKITGETCRTFTVMKTVGNMKVLSYIACTCNNNVYLLGHMVKATTQVWKIGCLIFTC